MYRRNYLLKFNIYKTNCLFKLKLFKLKLLNRSFYIEAFLTEAFKLKLFKLKFLSSTSYRSASSVNGRFVTFFRRFVLKIH